MEKLTKIMYLIVGIGIGIFLVCCWNIYHLGETPQKITSTIKEKCNLPFSFITGGVCFPSQPLVAVVRNSNGKTNLVWGEADIVKLLNSPNEKLMIVPDKQLNEKDVPKKHPL